MKGYSDILTRVVFCTGRSGMAGRRGVTVEVMGRLVLFGMLVGLVAPQNNEEGDSIQLFSGLHFQPRPELITYEATIPLLHTVTMGLKGPLLENNSDFDHCPGTMEKADKMCKLQGELKGLESEILKLIKQENSDYMLASDSGRTKRGLTFVGDFFKWCCDLATENQVSGLYDNQKTITQHTNDIIDSVDTQYRDLIKITRGLNNFTKNVQNITKKVQESFKMVEKELSEIETSTYMGNLKVNYAFTQRTWAYLLMNFYEDNVRQILEKCHLNRLSENLISKENLTHFLKDLQVRALEKDLQLAIPQEKIMLYYKLPMSTCKIVNETLLVKINVPLITSQERYRVYETVKTPVVWEDKVCHLDLEEKLVIKSQNIIKAIYADDEACNKKTFPLCLMPRETLLSRVEQRCINNILSPDSIEQLQQNCNFICSKKPKSTIITKLLPNKFLLTNIQDNVMLRCGNMSRVISKINTGTLKLNIPCECELVQDKEVLITKLKPCDIKDRETVSHPVQLIPAAWTKITALKLFPIESDIKHNFKNLSEIIDKNWTVTMPTYEMTEKQRIKHVTLPNNDYDLFGDTRLILYITLGWLGGLTVIVCIMAYCLHIQAIKIKFKTPPKDY